MNHFEQSAGRMVFETTMSTRARVGFALASAVPWLAPYELLVKPGWTADAWLAWLFAAVVSAGALAVSLMLLLVAVFGLNQRVAIEQASGTVQVRAGHLFKRPRTHRYTLADIERVEVIAHDWSDGPPSYEIRLSMRHTKPLNCGTFARRAEAEDVAAAIDAMVKAAA